MKLFGIDCAGPARVKTVKVAGKRGEVGAASQETP